MGIDKNTLYDWRNKYKTYFDNNIYLTKEALKKHKKIHKSSKKHIYEKTIIDYVNNNNGCSLDDIHTCIDKKISKSTICNILKANTFHL